MASFKCKCGDCFTTKQNMVRHQNGKSCKAGARGKTNKKPVFKCPNPKCKSVIGRSDNLKRHLETCKYTVKKKNNVVEGKNNKKNNLNNTNNGDIMYNNNNNNNNKKITINKTGETYINIMVFGKDGLKDLPYSKIAKILGANKNIFESTVETVNFDPECPEHHNVYCDDLKSGHGYVYGENGWCSKRMDEILEQILDSKTSDFSQLYELFGDRLTDKDKNRIMSAIEDAREGIIRHDGKIHTPGSRKRLKDQIRMIIYNNRDVVKETRQKTDKNKSKNKSKFTKLKPTFRDIPSEDEDSDLDSDNSEIDELTMDDVQNVEEDSYEEI